jgi:hypothetical protein
MNTTEKFDSWVDTLSNEELKHVTQIIQVSKDDLKSDWWQDLNILEVNKIKIGLQQLENGLLMTSEKYWTHLDD